MSETGTGLKTRTLIAKTSWSWIPRDSAQSPMNSFGWSYTLTYSQHASSMNERNHQLRNTVRTEEAKRRSLIHRCRKKRGAAFARRPSTLFTSTNSPSACRPFTHAPLHPAANALIALIGPVVAQRILAHPPFFYRALFVPFVQQPLHTPAEAETAPIIPGLDT